MCGVGLFLIAWWIIFTDCTTESFDFIDNIYLEYTNTPFGNLIGFLWVFVDGIILGAIFAWLYNNIMGHTISKNGSKEEV